MVLLNRAMQNLANHLLKSDLIRLASGRSMTLSGDTIDQLKAAFTSDMPSRQYCKLAISVDVPQTYPPHRECSN